MTQEKSWLFGPPSTPFLWEKPSKAIWEFPKIVVPQNGWFIRESPIKMDDLGVPLFLETPIYAKVSSTAFLPPEYAKVNFRGSQHINFHKPGVEVGSNSSYYLFVHIFFGKKTTNKQKTLSFSHLPSLKLTAKTPENGPKRKFIWTNHQIFRGKLAVSFRGVKPWCCSSSQMFAPLLRSTLIPWVNSSIDNLKQQKRAAQAWSFGADYSPFWRH